MPWWNNNRNDDSLYTDEWLYSTTNWVAEVLQSEGKIRQNVATRKAESCKVFKREDQSHRLRSLCSLFTELTGKSMRQGNVASITEPSPSVFYTTLLHLVVIAKTSLFSRQLTGKKDRSTMVSFMQNWCLSQNRRAKKDKSPWTSHIFFHSVNIFLKTKQDEIGKLNKCMEAPQLFQIFQISSTYLLRLFVRLEVFQFKFVKRSWIFFSPF